MEIALTKDAKGSLAIIYKAYEKRRKSGMKKSQAVYFDGFSEDSAQINPRVMEDRNELQTAGLISCDVVGGILLKDAAIIYMENKTSDTLKEWLSFASQFIP